MDSRTGSSPSQQATSTTAGSVNEQLTVEPLDIHDDVIGLEAAEVWGISLAHSKPGYQPHPASDRLASLRTPSDTTQRLLAICRQPTGRIVGAAYAAWDTVGPNQDPWIDAQVMPAARNMGAGSALAQWALDVLPDQAKHVYACSYLAPSPDSARITSTDELSDTEPSVRLGHSLGFTAAALEVCSQLTLPLSDSTLDAVTAPAQAMSQGYRVLSFVDGIDEQYIEQTGVLKGLLDVEAPTGDLDWEADPVTPEAYQSYLNGLAESQQHCVESIALCPQGNVVGQTQVVLSADTKSTMNIDSTLVHREHRGKGLGRLIKAANIQCLQKHFPDHHSLGTSSEVTNRHMLNLNDEFGFRSTVQEVVWKKDL